MRKLTGRESALIWVAAAGLIASLFYLHVMSPALDEMKKLDAKIPYVEKQLGVVRRIRTRCDQINNLIAEVQKRLDKREGNFQPRTFLDQEAKKVGMDKAQLKGIKPIASKIENDLYKEERYGVTLKKVSLETLVKYLYEIESSKYMLTVRKLNIDPDKRVPSLLNAKFEVSTFTRKTPQGKS